MRDKSRGKKRKVRRKRRPELEILVLREKHYDPDAEHYINPTA